MNKITLYKENISLTCLNYKRICYLLYKRFNPNNNYFNHVNYIYNDEEIYNNRIINERYRGINYLLNGIKIKKSRKLTFWIKLKYLFSLNWIYEI